MKKTRTALIVIICIAMIFSAVVGINLFIDSKALQLTARLNEAGLQTSLLDINKDIIFIPLGCRRYSIVDEWIRIFVYSDSASAQADASRLDSSGSTYNGILGKTVFLSWAKSPHFYIEDNLIIFYGGSNSTLLNTFETLFGPQFAGYY